MLLGVDGVTAAVGSQCGGSGNAKVMWTVPSLQGMIEELKIKVKSFEYARKYVLLECQKENGEKLILKMSREDLNWIQGRVRD